MQLRPSEVNAVSGITVKAMRSKWAAAGSAIFTMVCASALWADKPKEEAPSAQPPSQAEAKEQAKKSTYTVAAIGDSLTDAKSHGGKYLDYLREKCPASRFDNYGKGGQMVNQMRKRFARDVLGEPPVPGEDKPAYTHVIIFGGVNDLYSDLTAKRTPRLIQKDLAAMYGAARAKGMKVIAFTVAPWGGFSSYYNGTRGGNTLILNRWISSQLEAKTVDYVIDTYSMLSCGNSERLCPEVSKPFKDGLHFGPEGHQRIGKALYEKVFSDCR